MKKLIFSGFIILASTYFIFGMEEQASEKGHIFSKLDPELQLYVIEQGIKTELNSSDDPIAAVLNAFQYLNNVTSANRFLLSKRPELKTKLKLLAKEKFVPEYLDMTKEELNEKMDRLTSEIMPHKYEYKYGHYNDIIKLIISGVDLDLLRKFRFFENHDMYMSLLEFAAYIKDLDLARLLISYGADLKVNSPLFLLSEDEVGLKIAKLYLASGGDINKKDDKGMTVLMMVLPFGSNERLVEFLLNHGAFVDIKNDAGETALDIIKRYHPGKFNYQLELVEQAQNNPSKELLLESILHNRPYIVKLIIESNPEFVTLEFIKLARINSPASVPLLEKVFKLQQFVETARENLPSELIDRIGRFSLKN